MYPPADTTLEAARVQVAALRRLALADRMRIVDEHNRRLRAIATDAVRRMHPDYSDRQVQIAVLRRSIGEECFLRCFSEWSDVRP